MDFRTLFSLLPLFTQVALRYAVRNKMRYYSATMCVHESISVKFEHAGKKSIVLLLVPI